MYTIDWKRISNGGNFVVLEVADINMVKKKKKNVIKKFIYLLDC